THAHAFRPVGDFPRLANRDDRRQSLLIEPFQLAPAPDALFENRLEGKRVKHGEKSECQMANAEFTLWSCVSTFGIRHSSFGIAWCPKRVPVAAPDNARTTGICRSAF